MRLTVGQVHVDSEAGGRVPTGGDASGAAGNLERLVSVELAAQV